MDCLHSVSLKRLFSFDTGHQGIVHVIQCKNFNPAIISNCARNKLDYEWKISSFLFVNMGIYFYKTWLEWMLINWFVKF